MVHKLNVVLADLDHLHNRHYEFGLCFELICPTTGKLCCVAHVTNAGEVMVDQLYRTKAMRKYRRSQVHAIMNTPEDASIADIKLTMGCATCGIIDDMDNIGSYIGLMRSNVFPE